jgi:hypothetical protein
LSVKFPDVVANLTCPDVLPAATAAAQNLANDPNVERGVAYRVQTNGTQIKRNDQVKSNVLFYDITVTGNTYSIAEVLLPS